jgi:ELWxxDGT repeat protein
MFMKYWQITTTACLTLALAACSGSGGGSDVAGEGSGSIDPVTDPVTVTDPMVLKGYLTDSALVGVTYECDGKTELTGIDGLFKCKVLPVTFKLGNITLGTLSIIPEDLKVFPQDILDIPRTDLDDSRLVAIIRFLQSLDDDGEYDEVINILETVRIVLAQENPIDLTALSPVQLQALVESTGNQLVSSSVALAHLQATLDEQPDQCDVISNHKVSAEQGQQIRIHVYANGTDDILVDEPANGTAGIYNVGNEEVNVVYTSDSDFEGVDRFEYTVNGCTRTIGIAVIKDCSYVSDIVQTTSMNTDITFPVIQNRKFTTYLATSPVNGSVGSFITNNATAIAEYSPNKDFHGEDSFNFTIDGCTRTATITVTPPQVIVPFYDAASGWEPWVTDGTPAGTQILDDVFEGTSSSVWVERNGSFEPLVKHGDQYFYVSNRVSSTGKFILYSATVDGVTALKSDLDNTSGGTIVKGFDENIYFGALDDQGKNIWKSNGTVSGTKMVFDADSDSSVNGTGSPVVFDNKIFFTALTGNNGTNGIYKSDGTADGTDFIISLEERYTGLQVTDSKIYFQGADGQPWFTDGIDGSTAHTKQLKEVYPLQDSVDSSNAAGFTQIGSTVYFSAKYDGNEGYRALWKTTGEVGNAEVVKFFRKRSMGAELVSCHNKLYFPHYGLYVSDGTDVGTIHALSSVITGNHYIPSGGLQCFDDVLYAVAINENTDEKNLYSLNSEGVETSVNIDNSKELELMPNMIEGAVIFHTESETEMKLWKHDAINGSVLLKASTLPLID